MKAILCTDVTNDKNNERFDGEEFIVERVPEYQMNALDEKEEELDELGEKAGLPKPLRYLKFLTEMGAILLLIPLTNLFDGYTLREQFENIPGLFIFGLISLVVFPILCLLEKKMKKNVIEDDDTVRTLQKADSIVLASYDLLGIDPASPDMDIFMMHYKRKGTELKPKPIGGMFDYMNFEVKAFADEDNLYISDTAMKLALPKAAMTGIRRIDKKLNFCPWNKATAYDKGEYKQYKITANQYGMLFVKSCYALQIELNGEDYELYFPPYELSLMQELTGLDVTG